MKNRILTWVVFLLAVFGIVKAVQAFRNPWAIETPPAIIKALPVTPPGCGEDCKP